MKTRTYTAMLLITGLLFSAPLFGFALKFAPAGGAVWVLGKQIDESKTGFVTGASLELEVWKGFDYGFRYLYSNVDVVMPNSFIADTAVKSVDAKLVHQSFALTNSWSPGWKWVDPYVRGAMGLYSWRLLDGEDSLFKHTIINKKDTTVNELKATSFGLSVGGGLRIWPTEWIGLRLGVDYDLIFSEDKKKFGETDANENLLRAGGEVIFRLGLR